VAIEPYYIVCFLIKKEMAEKKEMSEKEMNEKK